MNKKYLRINKQLLYVISFFEGIGVLATELLGAKIIAPYYGTSLYVWASVLGVTLGALATGYFLGGKLSQFKHLERTLAITLLTGALFIAISPIIAPKTMLHSDWMGVRTGSLISCLIFLFPPIVCMGTISPMIIQLLNRDEEKVGQTAGLVYGISTLGGIGATFLFGFYFIPEIGITGSAISMGLILGVLPIIYFLFFYRRLAVTIIVATTLFLCYIQLSDTGVGVHDKYKVQYHADGLLSELMVLDHVSSNFSEDSVVIRKLLMNGIAQTNTQVGYEPFSLWEYVHKLAALASIKPQGSSALLLGMGGGSLAFDLIELGFNLEAVELDSRLVKISKTYFNNQIPEENIITDDARHYIRKCEKKFDVIIFDIVFGETQPSHLFTLEGFHELKEILASEGIVLINFQGTFEDPVASLGPKSIYKTLDAAGFWVQHFQEESPSEYNKDIIFLASIEQIDLMAAFDELRFNQWLPSFNFTYESLIPNQNISFSEGTVLVDDQPKLEFLNSNAMIGWRKATIEQNSRALVREGISIYR